MYNKSLENNPVARPREYTTQTPPGQSATRKDKINATAVRRTAEELTCPKVTADMALGTAPSERHAACAAKLAAGPRPSLEPGRVWWTPSVTAETPSTDLFRPLNT